MSAAAEAATPARRSRFDTLRRFRRNRLAVFGACVILLLVLACLIGPSLVP